MTADIRGPWPAFLQQRLDAWARDDLTRELRVLETHGTVALVDGREVVHFAGNDFLSLSAPRPSRRLRCCANPNAPWRRLVEQEKARSCERASVEANRGT